MGKILRISLKLNIMYFGLIWVNSGHYGTTELGLSKLTVFVVFALSICY